MPKIPIRQKSGHLRPGRSVGPPRTINYTLELRGASIPAPHPETTKPKLGGQLASVPFKRWGSAPRGARWTLESYAVPKSPELT
ncbi:hypothetical protein MCOR27_005043 [Pyricularia oryzae]|nr:hypothetical protein MCOR02_003769 [Pyricularia oryzae]KAI6265766.1 hypothetical protein MCOR26_010557 [Pyricularia oryzae]KAI6279579.1 hypothetical protein MCOR27_005043 [Pyricularia oryzae]KAI6305980.1 hypothetical protein MCOR29_010284 [Pyricularia oryzae]KAI6361733.1 hypothetical protein MCOR31_008562 [Pyricularia oryzae]